MRFYDTVHPQDLYAGRVLPGAHVMLVASAHWDDARGARHRQAAGVLPATRRNPGRVLAPAGAVILGTRRPAAPDTGAAVESVVEAADDRSRRERHGLSVLSATL